MHMQQALAGRGIVVGSVACNSIMQEETYIFRKFLARQA
jgi:hypothetical protein